MAWTQLQLQRAPELPADASLDRLLRGAGAGEPAARAVLGGLLGLLAGGLYVLLRRARPAATALREALRRPAPGLGPGLGLFLLAFGGLTLIELLTTASLPPRQVLASDGEGTTLTRPLLLELRLGGPPPADAAPDGAAAVAGFLPLPPPHDPGPRAVVRWMELGPWLEVRPGAVPVRVGGREAEPGLVPLTLGEPVQVGPWELRVEGPTPVETVRRRTVGQGLTLLFLLFILRSPLVRAGAPPGAPPPPGSELLRGARAWAACLPLYVLALLVTTGLLQLAGLRAAGHPLVRVIEREGLALLAPVALQAVLLAPIAEEALFRGLLLPALQRPLGRAAGLFLSAFVFAAIHGGLAVVLPMFLLGSLFGALRETAPGGSLLAPIAAHALHNGTTLLLVGAILLLG